MPSREPRWSVPSRQVQGRVTEKDILKKRGVKSHPNSGAGSIKYDGSDNETIVEVKDANKSYTLKGKELGDLYRHAAKEGKDSLLLIKFNDGIPSNFIVEVRVVHDRRSV